MIVPGSKPARFDPIAADGLRNKKEPLEIQAEHRIPIFFGNLRRRSAAVAARNVYQDIDLSHTREDIPHEPLNVRHIRRVRSERFRPRTQHTEFVGRSTEIGLRTATERDTGARARKSIGDRATYAARRTGDKRHAPGNIKQIG